MGDSPFCASKPSDQYRFPFFGGDRGKKIADSIGASRLFYDPGTPKNHVDSGGITALFQHNESRFPLEQINKGGRRA